MRIAYIAPYQGDTLLQKRPIVRNRSMSNRIKIELIATLLKEAGHDVEIISQGEVVESRLRFYPALTEEHRFHPGIPVHYGSVMPIRGLNGWWSNGHTLDILRQRHRAELFDLVIVFNLKSAQIYCANHAIRRLQLPVVLEYEDDKFVNVQGQAVDGYAVRRSKQQALHLFQALSGCIAVSPHLLAQVPATMPTLLLRGVVGADLIDAANRWQGEKKNVVLFSGTHIESNGVAHLIDGWREARLSGWELHITGYGQLTESLRQQASGIAGVTFHGLVSRQDLVSLLSSSKICINPHQVSRTPGNVFAFKIIEYLAAGAHVITTPMGALENDLEMGISYMTDNSPHTIAATLRRVVDTREYARTAGAAAQRRYGPAAVADSLNALLARVVDYQ
jgi:glycosyltransferase involved in cell wall biosynthesis